MRVSPSGCLPGGDSSRDGGVTICPQVVWAGDADRTDRAVVAAYPSFVPSTSDILDEHPAEALVCESSFREFGGRASFDGVISTVLCHEDNVLLKQCLSEPGDGRVLVIDGGGSRRVALLGDMVAGLAAANGWAGLVVNACVRDVAALRGLEIGIKALGATPRPSGKTGAGEIDIPVDFGGITFRPGAMLYSDEDGIVVLDR